MDCTVGLGGHTRALLEAGASRVLGLDRDTTALALAAASLAACGRPRRARARRLPGARRGPRRARHRPRRRRAGGPRRVVDAIRHGGTRVQLPARRAARHADGSDAGADRRGPAGRCRRRGSGQRDLPVRRRAFFAPHRAADRRGAPARPPSPRPVSSPASSAARSRARATSGSTRRRGRSRRCASGSTASSRGSTRSCWRRRGGCAPGRGSR